MPSRSKKPKEHVTRQEKALEVRSQILAAGRRWFGRKGLYETLVGEIAAEAGIAKGTFYLYFEDKEDLIRAVAEAAFEELGAAAAAACDHAGTWEDRVAWLAEAHVHFLVEQPDRMRILHQLRGMLTFERPEWLPLRACLEAHLELLANLLLAPPRPPNLTPRRAVEIGGILFGAISGALSVWAAIHGDRGLRSLPPGIPAATRALVSSLVVDGSGAPARRLRPAGDAARAPRARKSQRTARRG